MKRALLPSACDDDDDGDELSARCWVACRMHGGLGRVLGVNQLTCARVGAKPQTGRDAHSESRGKLNGDIYNFLYSLGMGA